MSLQINLTGTVSLMIQKEEIDLNEAMRLTANLTKILKKFEKFSATEFPDSSYKKYDIKLIEGYMIILYAKEFDLALINSISKLGELFNFRPSNRKGYRSNYSLTFKNEVLDYFNEFGVVKTREKFPDIDSNIVYSWRSKVKAGKKL